jgi:hypothetical protein
MRGGQGGIGGGGKGGASYQTGADLDGTSGTANTGGGGGGGGGNNATAGGSGGSGIVIVRYTITSDSQDPIGLIRYNTDLKGVEVYQSHVNGWVSDDSTRNFAGHNLLVGSDTYANSFSTEAIWTKTNNSTDVTAPDGSSTTTKAVSGTSGNSYFWRYSPVTYVVGQQYTTSFWCRTASGTGTFGVTAYPFNQTSETVNTTWRRISITHTQTDGTAPYLGVVSPSLSTTFYFWGWQVEQAATPGPYTRTVTAASPIPGPGSSGYRTHIYRDTGTSSFAPAVTGIVEVLVVAGGGGGGGGEGNPAGDSPGGAGAGGLVYNSEYSVIAGQIYTVTVGAGGAANTGSSVYGSNGENSRFGTILAIGGGSTREEALGLSGGSGGGGGGSCISGRKLGGGFVIGQGFQGGTGGDAGCARRAGAGGGGAGGRGSDEAVSNSVGGNGGPGRAFSITGQLQWYAAGGGAGNAANVAGTWVNNTLGRGGSMIGGNGGTSPSGNGTAGLANTGSGGGGAGSGTGTGGVGGSGIVVVRYRYE